MKDDAKPDLARFIDRWTIEYVRVLRTPSSAFGERLQIRKNSAWFIRATFGLQEQPGYAELLKYLDSIQRSR